MVRGSSTPGPVLSLITLARHQIASKAPRFCRAINKRRLPSAKNGRRRELIGLIRTRFERAGPRLIRVGGDDFGTAPSPRAHQVIRWIEFLTNFTLPSANQALTPPGW